MTNKNEKRENKEWSKVTYNLYGTPTLIENPKKQYTLLHSLNNQFCVAFKYNSDDNTWGHGHYFNNFYSALEFMFDSESEVNDCSEERKIYIANVIPADWFDADQLVSVVDEVLTVLADVPDIDEGHVIRVLKQLGYCN